MSRRNYLFVAALLVIVLFFTIPQYYRWLFSFILKPPISYATQFGHLDPEERRASRYGNSYHVYMEAVNLFQRLQVTDPVILLPPVGFLTKCGAVNVETVEPAQFYYFTGCKAVFASSPNVGLATWVMLPGKEINSAMLRKINGMEDRDSLIKIFLQFKPGS